MAYTVPENVTEIRKQAWATRRQKYGERGHASSYSRGNADCYPKMLRLLIELHIEGVLSEGKIAQATDLHRIEIRRMSDDLHNKGDF